MNIQPEEILLIAWFFVLGAVIGSFLNVVVYRLPLGISLIVPGSHCPKCKRRIRWHDNIPIASWLALGGKCRNCRTPISVQYPLVEGITAATFALLAAVEFVLKGVNLPGSAIQNPGGAELAGWNTSQLYGLLIFHLLLLCTIFAAAMIEIKNSKPPRRLFAPALIAGVFCPLIWPFLHPVPAWPGLPDWTSRILDCTAGLSVGGLLGFLAWKPLKSRLPETTSPAAAAWGLMCIAIFLGWQAAFGITMLAILLALTAAALGKIGKISTRRPFLAFLYVAAFAWILAWSPIMNFVKRFVD